MVVIIVKTLKLVVAYDVVEFIEVATNSSLELVELRASRY